MIKLWEELDSIISGVDDVRGDWLLLLGGVANKITAHTPALETSQLNSFVNKLY